MSVSITVLKDKLSYLEMKQQEAKADLMGANQRLMRAQTDRDDIERAMDERDEIMKDVRIGIETLEKYGA